MIVLDALCRNTKISQYIIKTLASERKTITEGKRNEKRQKKDE